MKDFLDIADFKKLSNVQLFEVTQEIVKILNKYDCYFVGGCVRDAFCDSEITDFDIEVFGVPFNELEDQLKKHFHIILTGKCFCVLKLKDYAIDISVPRSERRVGDLHTDFEIVQLKNCDMKEAASRRDFTINSIYFDIKNNKTIDPYSGVSDLKNKILRHTSDRFPEDSLRVLRGMQLAGRFELTSASDTIDLCKTLNNDNIPKDRLFDEFKKFILKSKKPSCALKFLKDCEWTKFFTEIHELIGCTQDCYYHPEGDVFEHTCMVMDEFAATKTGNNTEDLIVGFACLCHDFGKPDVKRPSNGERTDLSHADIGAIKAKKFLDNLSAPNWLTNAICPLIKHHMEPRNFIISDNLTSKVLHLANDCGNIEELVRLAKCDALGRKIWNEKYDLYAENLLLETARNLNILNKKPEPIITGRILISLGFKQSESFAEILNRCFEGQLNREFLTVDDGIKFLKKKF